MRNLIFICFVILISCNSNKPIVNYIDSLNHDSIYIKNEKIEIKEIIDFISKKRKFLEGYMKVDKSEFEFLFNNKIDALIDGNYNSLKIQKNNIRDINIKSNCKVIYIENDFIYQKKYILSDVFYFNKKECFFMVKIYITNRDIEEYVFFMNRKNKLWVVTNKIE